MPIIKPYKGKHPVIPDDCFIAENAVVIGDVILGDGCSVWYNVVIRGDVHYVRIGGRTNVQDGSVLHVTGGGFPLNIGSEVVIGHSTMIHGCTLADHTLIGIGAKVLDGASVGSYSLVAAGALVREGFEVPPGVLVAGVPAKIKRDTTPEERRMIDVIAEKYVAYGRLYREEVQG